jgi:hypothetical protein
MKDSFKWHMNVHIDRADVDIEVNYECLTIEVNDFNADTVVTFDKDMLDECLDTEDLLILQELCRKELARRTEDEE